MTAIFTVRHFFDRLPVDLDQIGFWINLVTEGSGDAVDTDMSGCNLRFGSTPGHDSGRTDIFL